MAEWVPMCLLPCGRQVSSPPQLIYAENCQPAAVTYFPLYSTVSGAWQGHPASRKPGVQKPRLSEQMHWGCLLTICFTEK